MQRAKKARPVPLSALLKEGKIRADDHFVWKYDIKRQFTGVILENGRISCEALNDTLEYSPSSFCESVARSYERKGKISGAEEGLVNGRPLCDINDEYRRENDMTTRKRNRESGVRCSDQQSLERTSTESDDECPFSQPSADTDNLAVALTRLGHQLAQVKDITERTGLVAEIASIRSEKTEVNVEAIRDSQESMRNSIHLLSNDVNSLRREKDQEVNNLRENICNLREENAVLLNRAILRPLKKLRKETYNDNAKLNDPDKEKHNRIFPEETFRHLKLVRKEYGRSREKYVLHLDGETARTTDSFVKLIGRESDLYFCLPNFSTSFPEMKKNLTEKGYDKFVDALPVEADGMLSSSYIIARKPLVAIWLDTTQEFPTVSKSVEHLLSSRMAIPKCGVVVALTWILSRNTDGKRFNDLPTCLDSLYALCADNGASYSPLKTLDKKIDNGYFPHRYGQRNVFMIGKLQFH